jgi:hypothetical protein
VLASETNRRGTMKGELVFRFGLGAQRAPGERQKEHGTHNRK